MIIAALITILLLLFTYIIGYNNGYDDGKKIYCEFSEVLLKKLKEYLDKNG